MKWKKTRHYTYMDWNESRKNTRTHSSNRQCPRCGIFDQMCQFTTCEKPVSNSFEMKHRHTHTQRYIYLSCIGSVLGVENHWIKFTVENFIKLIKPFSMHIAHIHSKWHDRIRYVWIEICTQKYYSFNIHWITIWMVSLSEWITDIFVFVKF